MKRICAWCNKFMGFTGSESRDTGLITHTICAECADNLDFQLGVSLRRYLDSLRIPVLVVDEDNRILLTNEEATRCGKGMIETGEAFNGKVFECAHARLPERCSHDIHCSACTIRFAVTDTYRTGNSHDDLPALLNDCTSSPAEKFDFHISTRKVDAVVYLRIDRV